MANASASTTIPSASPAQSVRLFDASTDGGGALAHTTYNFGSQPIWIRSNRQSSGEWIRLESTKSITFRVDRGTHDESRQIQYVDAIVASDATGDGTVTHGVVEWR